MRTDFIGRIAAALIKGKWCAPEHATEQATQVADRLPGLFVSHIIELK
jgi:hypothetical protein